MFKIIGFFLLALICISCNSNLFNNTDSQSSACEYIHSAGISLELLSESIRVSYNFYNIANSPIFPSIAPELSCEPETIELFISTDGIEFEKVATLEEISGSYLIEDLQECEFITVKIEGSHPDFATVSTSKTALVGEVLLPQLTSNPLPMEEFTIGNDLNQIIYKTSSDKWYESSLSNPSQGQNILSDVVRAKWNPTESNKVAGVENILVPILENLNGSTSKYLVEYDLNTGTKEILHEIENHMDFDNEVYSPELYWIHEFYYSLDGQSIYFISNKDNGGSSIFDQKVYDNIWKLNLQTKEIEVITDFFPLDFDLIDFIEDPKNQGNFYLSGGKRNVEMIADGNSYFVNQMDIHYYNSFDKSITPVFENNEVKEYLSIDPTGEHLVFTTKSSGLYELRSLSIATDKQKQLTFSDDYRPLKKWTHLNWISSNEFTTIVSQDGNLNFATFSIE